MSENIINSPIYFKKVQFNITDGYLRYASVGAIPSTNINSFNPNDLYKKRIWNFNITAILKKSSTNEYTITINGNNIEPKPVGISFEGDLTGVVSIKGKVIDANRYVKYEWKSSDPYEITLFFTSPCTIKKEALVNFNININD